MAPSMNPAPETEYYDIFPYVRVSKDGSIQRLAGTGASPAGFDPETAVLSKDILISPETGVSARLYIPNDVVVGAEEKSKLLPLVIYFHGGGFFISSVADPYYHGSLNRIAAEAKVLIVSVNYRLAPEHPLPAAYEDSWAALQWVASHVGGGSEEWVKNYADMDRVFLAGDSAGANIGHHLALRIKDSDTGRVLKLSGIIMIHPYFWGKEAIGCEVIDGVRRKMVDEWWRFVCPSDKGNDDPLINPFADGAPSLKDFGCGKIMVLVAGKDILRERGKLYYEKLKSCGWEGDAECVETEEEDHDFHIFNPDSHNAKELVKTIAAFIKQYKN